MAKGVHTKIRVKKKEGKGGDRGDIVRYVKCNGKEIGVAVDSAGLDACIVEWLMMTMMTTMALHWCSFFMLCMRCLLSKCGSKAMSFSTLHDILGRRRFDCLRGI